MVAWRSWQARHPAPVAASIRTNASQHHLTALYLWRTALEVVNPEVLPVVPNCALAVLVNVYDMLDVATDA